MKLNRIVVPVDFSRTSLQALEYAADLAKPFAPEVVAVFVSEPIVYASPSDLYGASTNLAMLQKEQELYGRKQLTRLQQRFGARIPKLRTALLTGTADVAITEAAKKLKGDLIVMSTHGRTGLSHLLLGSVAEKVVRTAPCPVLTVRGRPRRQRAGSGARKTRTRKSAPKK